MSQNTAGLTTVTSSLGTLSTKISRLSAQLARLPSAISSAGFGFGSRPRAKARGGKIQKFASGGYVKGPSHGAGGVLAELEGGEYVVPKYLMSGTPGRGVKPAKIQPAKTGKLTKDQLKYASDAELAQFLKMPNVDKNERAKKAIANEQDRREELVKNAALVTRKGQEKGKEKKIQGARLTGGFGVSFLDGPLAPISATLSQVLDSGPKTGRRVRRDAIAKKTGKSFSRDSIIAGATITTQGKPTVLQGKGKEIFTDEIRNEIPQMFQKATNKFRGTELQTAALPLN